MIAAVSGLKRNAPVDVDALNFLFSRYLSEVFCIFSETGVQFEAVRLKARKLPVN